MRKKESKNQHSFEFDGQGAVEVSEQIMDAYNSGYIDQDNFQKNRGVLEVSDSDL